MGESIERFVVDASFVLAFFLPDEDGSAIDRIFGRYAEGEVELTSTPLLPFEVLNGLRSALLRGRVSKETAKRLAEAFIGLEITLKPVDHKACFALSIQEDLSVYDASYVLLARQAKAQLLSLDEGLKSLAA
jgi:predicted nucleic acid-binding protein